MLNPVQKALWFVESHSRQPLTLETIAAACHVSPFHLTRAFAETLGWPLMRYVRARRLSEAARQLANGADDILSVALDAGYGSHEAFTRAFRELFALTPEQVRAQGQLNNLPLLETITMNTTVTPTLPPPRFEMLEPTVFAGLVERYACQAPGGIPHQWQRFQPYLGQLSLQASEAAYGVCYNFDEEGNFDYLCGVAVKDTRGLPAEFQTFSTARQKYVVFRHRGHVAGIRATFSAIWSDWFPTSGYQAAQAPTLERYGPEFDPRTGEGGLEIWIAIENATAPQA